MFHAQRVSCVALRAYRSLSVQISKRVCCPTELGRCHRYILFMDVDMVFSQFMPPYHTVLTSGRLDQKDCNPSRQGALLWVYNSDLFLPQPRCRLSVLYSDMRRWIQCRLYGPTMDSQESLLFPN